MRLSVLFLFLCSVTVGLCDQSTLFVGTVGVKYFQNFDSFKGEYATLPVGWGVSKDGVSPMDACDTDFRGIHPGGVVSGGCYAWRLQTNVIDYALGYQPTADEFTPGFFLFSVSNATGVAIKSLAVAYEVVYLNNADRSSSIDFEFSLDGLEFVRVESARVCTPESAGLSAVWKIETRSLRFDLPVPVAAGQRIIFRWYGDDVAGKDSRDEYGINNVAITLYRSKGTIIEIR